jgi:cellulose synthase/poly-beta-1,6-N-acetylglucosamine synthase-like glycosyltransferase
MISPSEIALYAFTGFLSLIFIGLLLISIGNRNRDTEEDAKTDIRSLVIIPCRGLDFSLRENISSLMNQDYDRFTCVAVVDEMDDPAVAVLMETGISIVKSGYTCNGCSGKVRAISTAISMFTDYDAYVIADSDILVGRDWLRHLLTPLSGNSYALVTAFPYFKPVGGFWSKVKMVWGFVGVGMMESEVTRFGWGGSLAFRRDLIASAESMNEFSSSISDDIALTRLARKAGKKIFYSRKAQPMINSDDDFGVFMEWSNRQTALSESSSPRVFQYGMLFFGTTCFLMLSSIVMSIFISPLFLAFLLPSVITALKNAGRSRESRLFVFFMSFGIPFLYLYNLLAARRMKRITWRGREYSMK